jgi:hypothetical protein
MLKSTNYTQEQATVEDTHDAEQKNVQEAS